ncbi:MAG: ATP-binding protein [Syntrophobacteraceae bacterium]
MKIGVVGGGKRCKALLEMLDSNRLPSFNVKVVGVADPNMDAVGVRLAQKKGIYTTRDYEDFRGISGLDCIVELMDTQSISIIESFHPDAPLAVKQLESALSRLLEDMIRFRNEYLLEKRQLDIHETLVDSIFSNIQDEVLLLLPDFKILDVNEAFVKSVAISKEDIIGKHCYEIIHCSENPIEEMGNLCPFIKSLETGGTAHAIREYTVEDGGPIYRETTTMPLKNENGKVELVMAIMRDITDELERRVEQRTRKLKMNLARLIHEDKMIALGKLVSSAVHEINNPLSGILALARLMHQRVDEGGVDEADLKQFGYYLHLIDTEAARCGNIVNNLLSFSRQAKIEYRKFQLNDIINNIVLLFRHKAEQNVIRLQTELAEELPEMTGDPCQIQQCLINLLFNAMEAMPNGGRVTIRTYFDSVHDLICAEFEDTGVGIPNDMISKIFEPFYSTKQGEKGVGLGLSVVYGIIKEHQGTIYIKSEVDKGSKFILRFGRTESGETAPLGRQGVARECGIEPPALEVVERESP